MTVGLDATYSIGRNLSGIGVYSREIMNGLARAHADEDFLFCYRPHRFLRSYREKIPNNAARRLLIGEPPGDIFHALNQRLDTRPRRAVTTFHDLFVLTGDYSSPEFRARFAEQARRAAQNSDLIIAVSQFTASQVERLLQFPADRIRVVPHGVRMPAPADTMREKLILFTGVIQRRKNIARLVKAFERLEARDWRLVLAGATNGFGAEEELRAVEESPRRSLIDVRGYVSSAELENLYRRASIFAFPSLDEGFGLPILEAMAHGVAVITSDTSGMAEVAGDAALRVDPLDVDSIHGALSVLVNQGDRRGDLAGRGLKRAREFSWESAIEKTWAVYHEL